MMEEHAQYGRVVSPILIGNIDIRMQRIHPNAILPTYAHPGDSGMDVCSVEDVNIPPGETRLVHTGLKVAVPDWYEVQVRPKSGLALKYSITVPNTPGTIDAGYRGEIGVILINHSLHNYEVHAGDKIAQLVVCPVVKATVVEVNALEDTPRGTGGFGSTGR